MDHFNRRPVFDAVRSILGRGFQRAEISNLDTAIDRALGKFGVSPSPLVDDENSPVSVTTKLAMIKHLRREEGVRYKAYKDHLGYWTNGIGRLIDPRKGGRYTPAEKAILVRNVPARQGTNIRSWILTDPEADMLLDNDIEDKMDDMEGWPAWERVKGNTARATALLSMCFQMGSGGLSKFKNTLKMIAVGNYSSAASNMLKSKWAKQTPARAKRVSEMMRTGRLS